MSILKTDAHCVEGDFEAMILKDYGVKIINREHTPWEYTFQGTRESLINMYRDHWLINQEPVIEEEVAA